MYYLCNTRHDAYTAPGARRCYAWPRAPSSTGLAGGSRRTSDVGPWDCPSGGLVLEPLLVLTPGGWSQLVDAVSLCG